MLTNTGSRIGTFLNNTEAKHGAFLKNLGSRAGMLLKGFAVLVLVLGIILSLIFGISTFFQEPAWAKQMRAQYGTTPYSYGDEIYSEVKAQYRTTGLITLASGCAGSIFTFLLLLGFGQLVEEHTLMRQLMEHQLIQQNDPEPEEKHAEAKPDHRTSPTWMENDKQSEDNYSAPWRLKSYPKDNRENDNQKG